MNFFKLGTDDSEGENPTLETLSSLKRNLAMIILITSLILPIALVWLLLNWMTDAVITMLVLIGVMYGSVALYGTLVAKFNFNFDLWNDYSIIKDRFKASNFFIFLTLFRFF